MALRTTSVMCRNRVKGRVVVADLRRCPGDISRPVGHDSEFVRFEESQCCDTWKQATSYCETDFGLTEFCGCSPA